VEPRYICPKTRKPLEETTQGLLREDGLLYRFIDGCGNDRIPDFVTSEHQEDMDETKPAHVRPDAVEIYRSFIQWLFATFEEDESLFRCRLVQRLRLTRNDKVLITGCGLGDDIPPIIASIGPEGEIYAQDLSTEMIIAAARRMRESQPAATVHFSVSNATQLPFMDNFFDAAFHFGGINVFDDVKAGIDEMDRVVKPGGHVVFGDEGVAPWLKSTQYGRMVITNNPLWSASAPIDLLPFNASDVNLTWLLGNCFYLISFEVSDQPPQINMDVPHKGRRGGSMRTRFFGQLEGVTEESKSFVMEDAKRRQISIHQWLEEVISERKAGR